MTAAATTYPTLDREGDVFVLRLGEDENRFTRDFLDTVDELLDEVENTSGTALVTTGIGKQYSSGLDIEVLMNPADDTALESYLRRVEGLLGRMLTLPLYTVAAINGHAFGGGAMLASAHDLRLMRTERGFWCLPEVDLGLPFRPGMQALLLDRLPAVAAHAAMVTSARYGAEDALAQGFVDGLADADELLADAVAAAATQAGKDRGALGRVKRDLHATAHAALTA